MCGSSSKRATVEKERGSCSVACFACCLFCSCYLQQNCTMLIGMWFYLVKPEVHVAVAFWMAGMFCTHRKLQHKQLEWPYYCTENMFIELGRWHRSMRDLCSWICIVDVVVFDSSHCICPMQDIHWRTCELFMICYTLFWMKLSVYITE